MTNVYIDRSVSQLRELHQDILQLDKSTITIRDFIDLQAQRLLKGHSAGDSSVVFHLACWCKPLISKPAQEIMDTPLSLDNARQSIAAEYGFPIWSAVEELGNMGFDSQFEACIDTMLVGDISALQRTLKRHPHFATQRSQYGHKATLLHYLAANGVESYRQVTPENAAELASTLIIAGADASAKAHIYGGSTVVELLLTSAHPASAGVVQPVKDVLDKALLSK